MQIEYLGERAFKIKTKTMTVVIEPGEGMKKQTADIVCLADGGDVKNISGPVKRDEVFVIERAGEYEIGGVEIRTIPVGNGLITIVYAEEVTLVHLDGANGELTDKQIEELSMVEVLMMPVDAKKELVKKLAPLVLIPMKYESADEVDKFISEGGFLQAEKIDKLIVKQDTLPEDMQVVVLGKE